MKKVFAMLAIAAVVVACNNESATSAEDAAKKTADSIRVADSVAAEQAKAAATQAADTLKAAADSLKAAADSLKK
ncbi:hypothetical protein LZZ85_15045 [Terrimonas sp. NA20]|uniref:Lipoprotein n=1 Tax=Terrimonas ginsenosidimutans TaxID=2908004 RepID=A0ABS9KTF8_9BACT|nr:hypothetical protein [Terrimonas ginsenosidimutans]MCG2615616.1 hypothetical protein [Terrimonas ginsenosidimutans]